MTRKKETIVSNPPVIGKDSCHQCGGMMWVTKTKIVDGVIKVYALCFECWRKEK